jgi:hypothetical protein
MKIFTSSIILFIPFLAILVSIYFWLIKKGPAKRILYQKILTFDCLLLYSLFWLFYFRSYLVKANSKIHSWDFLSRPYPVNFQVHRRCLWITEYASLTRGTCRTTMGLASPKG